MDKKDAIKPEEQHATYEQAKQKLVYFRKLMNYLSEHDSSVHDRKMLSAIIDSYAKSCRVGKSDVSLFNDMDDLKDYSSEAFIEFLRSLLEDDTEVSLYILQDLYEIIIQ